MSQSHDAAVIGMGFFGLNLALYLAGRGMSVALLDHEPQACQHSSTINQARIHNGYHYPRSFTTAYSSHRNYPRFKQDFGDCLGKPYAALYAIGRHSHVSAGQFEVFCGCVGIPLQKAKNLPPDLFNPSMVEAVYHAEEASFHTGKITEKLLHKVQAEPLITALPAHGCERIESCGQDFLLRCGSQRTLSAKRAFNVTYAGLNHMLHLSGFPLLDLKNELVELCLTEVVDPALKSLGVTIMDGPFFSLMPYPAANLHSLTHVRYTPRKEWHDKDRCIDPYVLLIDTPPSNYLYMHRDAVRYMPILEGGLRYRRSLFTIKTVLRRSEINDSRPIVFKIHQREPFFVSILGAKFDNIYDMYEKLDEVLQ